MNSFDSSKTIKIKYALKRFLLFFSYGFTCSFFPFSFFAAMYGLPSVLLGSIALATADTTNLRLDLDNQVPVAFTRVHKITLLVLISIITFYHICLVIYMES